MNEQDWTEAAEVAWKQWSGAPGSFGASPRENVLGWLRLRPRQDCGGSLYCDRRR